MKKTVALSLLLIFLLSFGSSALADTTRYDVSEPITIEWWHSTEDQWLPLIEETIARFHQENPLITVEAVYIGSLTDLHRQLIAATAAGNVPALSDVHMRFIADYGYSGLCEILDPYIEAYDFPINDFSQGFLKSTQYEEEQIVMPFRSSTLAMLYNKTAAETEGITMPKTFDEMEEFLEKATVFNPDGTTARYGTVFGGWHSDYYQTLFFNHGVQLVLEDGLTSDVNSAKSVELTTKMKEWIDKGYAYYAYGTGASSDMRQTFWDARAFSVFHTSSLFDTYIDNVGDAFEVGIAWYPGSSDSFISEPRGSGLMIPRLASQRQKNAAWQFLMFVAKPEINLYWADETGYLPTRLSLVGTEDYQDYLNRKPNIETIIEMTDQWLQPKNPHPAFQTVADEWRHALARIFIENAPIQETLDNLKEQIEEVLEDF